MNDWNFYYCYIYNKYQTTNSGYSNQAQIDVVSPLDTNVTPSHIVKRYGENVTFTCQTSRETEYWFKFKWYKIPQGGSRQILLKETRTIQFNDNNKTMTMVNLPSQENSMTIICLIFKGSTSVTGSNSHVTLSLHRSDETMTTNTNIVTSENSPSERSQGPVHPQSPTTSPPASITDSLLSGPVDRQSTPSAPQTSTPLPTKKQDPDPDSNSPSTGSTDSPVILVGGAAGAGFLVLLIVILLYFLVFRRRSKPKINDRPKSNTSQDDGGDSDTDGISETQLDGVTPRCDQENDHASSAGKRSVESPRESVTVVVTSDLHQQAETKHDQDNVDKPLSTETDGSVKDGEKRNDKQNHPESMYAVVDKSRAKSKTLGAISTVEASWKVSGGGKDGSKLNRGTDTTQTLSSYSKHETPSKHQKSTVAVKDLSVLGCAVDRQPSAKKPPRVIPYHLSKRRASTMKQDQAALLKQMADLDEDCIVKDDPRRRNVEGLIYADLDLSRGSARINSPEEETVYADIGNK